MGLPATFANNTTPTGQQLDNNFNALGALTPIPCAVAGTNALTLTPETTAPNVPAYSNFIQFTGVAPQTNTGPVTVAVGSLAALGVYKDTILGPKALTGGEIVQNCALVVMYDSSLNSGAGGFHLLARASAVTRNLTTTTSIAISAINPQTSSVATILLPGTSVGDIINIGFPPSPSVGLVWQPSVVNAGTISLAVFNAFSLATVTPTFGVYRVTAQGYS